MLKVKLGDRQAFARLFERFNRPILAYCAWMLGSQDRAEEVTQEVFLKVYRARESYEPTARFTTWLWTIARNAALTQIRDHGDELKLEESLERDNPESGETESRELADAETLTPDEWAELGERQEMLRAAIGKLPATQREALLMVVEGGLSYLDTAKAMGTTESAVKSLIVRARRSLETARDAYRRAK